MSETLKLSQKRRLLLKTSLILSLWGLSACQIQSEQVSLPSPTSSSTPTATSPASMSQGSTLTFSINPPSAEQTSLCLGAPVTVYLEQNYSKLTEFPIVLQMHPKVLGAPEPEVKPRTEAPSDPILVGHITVAQRGQSATGFILREAFLSRSGEIIEPKSGDVVSVFAEESPNTYVWIKDFRVCSRLDSSQPDVQPSLAPDNLIANNPAFQNQKIYTAVDRSDFVPVLKLENQNGLIYWFSNQKKAFDIAGKVIQSLKATSDIPQSVLAEHSRLFPVLNEQGSGLFIWKEHEQDISPGSSPPPYTLNWRPVKQFTAQNPVSQIEGVFTDGQIDLQGNGSLYSYYDLNSDGSFSSSGLNLRRYPIKDYQLQSPVELIMSGIPGTPVVRTDGQGNGFILWRKELIASIDPPYNSGIIYLSGYQPTGETLELLYRNPNMSAPSVSVQNGNGTIVIPVLGYPVTKQWQLYPVKNYRIDSNHKQILTVTDPQSEFRRYSLNVSSEGNGLLAVVDSYRMLRVRRIKNFQPVGPYYRLLLTQGNQTNYADAITQLDLELNEDGDGLIVWTQLENFKDQMVETEPGVMNSHTLQHVYIRPVRNFQTW